MTLSLDWCKTHNHDINYDHLKESSIKGQSEEPDYSDRVLEFDLSIFKQCSSYFDSISCCVSSEAFENAFKSTDIPVLTTKPWLKNSLVILNSCLKDPDCIHQVGLSSMCHLIELCEYLCIVRDILDFLYMSLKWKINWIVYHDRDALTPVCTLLLSFSWNQDFLCELLPVVCPEIMLRLLPQLQMNDDRRSELIRKLDANKSMSGISTLFELDHYLSFCHTLPRERYIAIYPITTNFTVDYKENVSDDFKFMRHLLLYDVNRQHHVIFDWLESTSWNDNICPQVKIRTLDYFLELGYKFETRHVCKFGSFGFIREYFREKTLNLMYYQDELVFQNGFASEAFFDYFLSLGPAKDFANQIITERHVCSPYTTHVIIERCFNLIQSESLKIPDDQYRSLYQLLIESDNAGLFKLVFEFDPDQDDHITEVINMTNILIISPIMNV